MSIDDTKGIRQKIADAESQYNEALKSCDLLDELSNKSIARFSRALKNEYLTADHKEIINEMMESERKSSQSIADMRCQLKYEYTKKINEYEREIEILEK